MSGVNAPGEVLLSLNLAAVTQNQDKIFPIISECEGHELGTSSQTYVAGFAATPEGVNQAVSCAQRIQIAMPPGTLMAIAIHVGDIGGEGLSTLTAMRRVTRSGAITLSQAVMTLGGASLPIALEPLETSKGPTPFFTTAKTRFIDIQAAPGGAAPERTSTKIIYAPTANTALRRAAPVAASDSDFESKWSLITHFGPKVALGIVVVAALLNRNATEALFDRLKGTVLQTSVAQSMAEKSAKLDVEIKKTADMVTQPIALAKKAAAQASQVSPELLALAPEIRAEDVSGKPRPVATEAPAAAAAVPAPSQPAPATVAAAHPSNRDSATTATSVEEALLPKCATDAEFCHSTGLVFIKDNSFGSALKFLNQACNLGLAKSCVQAATLYQNGQGAEPSEPMAKTLLAKACNLKDGAACTQVGLAYLHGTGVPVSLTKAREAMDLGCALGHGPACLVLALGAQVPPVVAGRAPASSADNLARGCELMKIPSCLPHQPQATAPAPAAATAAK